jgi:hypothetical protein
MGTRNLTKVIDKDGVIRVAQYGQWDGYPSYSGVRLLSFISEPNMLDKIEKSLSKCRFGSKEEIDATYAVYNESELKDDFGGFGILFPSLSRDTGVDILKTIVYSNNDVLLWDETEFENDGLFCEGVYTLNYQTKQFISWFNGDTVSFDFDKLPMEEEYLDAWKALTPTP